MTNMFPPIKISTPVAPLQKRSEETQKVGSLSDERPHVPTGYKYERRKNSDRRKNRGKQPGLYEFRSGRGRRRADMAGQHIRIDV